jgi:heme-degrading monooxygenase HmoA
MIRVMYRWDVGTGMEQAFCRWWHDGTLAIRRDRAGALGSVLLRTRDTPPTFVAVARWETTADLEAFWADAGGQAFPDAELTAIEIFDELDDLEVR